MGHNVMIDERRRSVNRTCAYHANLTIAQECNLVTTTYLIGARKIVANLADVDSQEMMHRMLEKAELQQLLSKLF
jgi:hypothetical protein